MRDFLLGSCSLSLLPRDRLDVIDSNRLLHVTDSEKAKRRVLHGRLNARRIGRDAKYKSRVATLDVLGLGLDHLAHPTVMLRQQLVKLARNVRRVAVSDRCVALPDPPRVRHDDDLRSEVLDARHRLVLRVRRNEANAGCP